MSNSCQWIDGEPAGDDSCKCNAPVRAGSVYCLEHHDLAYLVPGSDAHEHQLRWYNYMTTHNKIGVDTAHYIGAGGWRS